MAQTASNIQPPLIVERLVRYAELRPCTTAFIDTRTPGSAKKENFTIIGPGVAENPDQHVHISIPHGFNIGGARQPPGCVNSQHSHETAEVFVVHTGTWSFCVGANGEDGEIVLSAGDTISIPTQVFRGFKNVGDENGFLFAVLGGDDPGRVTWAPYVFENAKTYGLVLAEDGNLIDTTRGQELKPEQRPMKPTTEADLAKFNRLTSNDLERCVVRRSQLDTNGDQNDSGIRETPLIGEAGYMGAGKMDWPHGFHVRHMRIEPGASTDGHFRREEEVILMHRGALSIRLQDRDVCIGPGDVMTLPIKAPRSFSNDGPEVVHAYVIRGGDQPLPPTTIDQSNIAGSAK